MGWLGAVRVFVLSVVPLSLQELFLGRVRVAHTPEGAKGRRK